MRRFARGALGCTLVIILLAGCAGTAPTGYRSSSKGLAPELLDGAAFGVAADDRVADVELLRVNEDMRQFLAAHVTPGMDDQQKVRRILQAIISDGLHLSYDSFKTLTAEEAFYAREGNCMSFTNLFVVLF